MTTRESAKAKLIYCTKLLIIAFSTCALSACLQKKDMRIQPSHECEGKLKTLFFEIPLYVKLNNNSLELKTNVNDIVDPRITGFLQKYDIKIPNINGKYKLDVQHSDGILARMISTKRIEVDHFHTKATLLLDECILEYPIEIDSTKILFDLPGYLQDQFD